MLLSKDISLLFQQAPTCSYLCIKSFWIDILINRGYNTNHTTFLFNLPPSSRLRVNDLTPRSCGSTRHQLSLGAARLWLRVDSKSKSRQHYVSYYPHVSLPIEGVNYLQIIVVVEETLYAKSLVIRTHLLQTFVLLEYMTLFAKYFLRNVLLVSGIEHPS